VATLQHVLEGYKVADEIARHGAGGSCFTDWWGFKFEVYDAIPYAGSLMHARGVNVSFNSDSSELARRMYLEAAKAVKYGGTSEVEALKFVTLNPAKQLGVDKWVGSLEPGKDADFALWTKSPLAYDTVCEQTWIEGRKYFDRAVAAKRTETLAKERTDLIAKAKKLTAAPGGGDASAEAKAAFFQRVLEKMHELGIAECLDCKLTQRRE
jgi:N-acetylglucosamine-6-phosphate deacetylase